MCDILNICWNIRPCYCRWFASLSDGAYPRPKGRGIAPVQPVTAKESDELVVFTARGGAYRERIGTEGISASFSARTRCSSSTTSPSSSNATTGASR
ncbi:hypothetical protein ELS17_12970 [Natrinema altunense]|uniref:Uncharacterized protein n=1 Tax=Natrinema altunense TaxID=222984 RepID=A0A482XU79_9EURY|nr:hypothetical protein ELS17_12970 [Natrinema altunense]